jgi:hypothetical protein
MAKALYWTRVKLGSNPIRSSYGYLCSIKTGLRMLVGQWGLKDQWVRRVPWENQDLQGCKGLRGTKVIEGLKA